jgi:predicted protein tyrosine phosphatase
MIKDIKCLSFWGMTRLANDNIDNPEFFKENFFISVIDMGLNDILEESENIINLHFADIPYPIKGHIHFDETHAMKVKTLLNRIKNTPGESGRLYINCHAGVSRSGALGTYAREYLDMDYQEFKNMNPHIVPNRHVLKVLGGDFFLSEEEGLDA